jgi:O-glycosyl hydrolase
METGNYLSPGTEPGSYDEALIWAQKIHHALVHGDCQVVCYWSLFFDKKGDGLIYCPRNESAEIEITPKYYTSMHTYRFVRPGMVRCEAASGDPRLLVSAFRGDASRVVVTINTGDAPVTIQPPFPSATCHETTEETRCASRPWRGPELFLSPRSVVTLVGTE